MAPGVGARDESPSERQHARSGGPRGYAFAVDVPQPRQFEQTQGQLGYSRDPGEEHPV